MLQKIEIKDAFVHKNTVIDFQKGLSHVQGANEAGKSLVFEMIRWALYGNKALRTTASDYKGASAALTFSVGDETYKVERTTGNALLYQDDELIARSTTAVNRKIVELIGYGLKTFDNVNMMLQGQTEKLTQMSSIDRKKFMDELIGAAQIDQLIADYKSEADVKSGELKALEALWKNVEAPVNEYDVSLVEAEAEVQRLTQEEFASRELVRKQQALISERNKIVIVPHELDNLTKDEIHAFLHELEEFDAASKRVRPSINRLRNAIEEGDTVDVGRLTDAALQLSLLKNTARPKFTEEQISEYRRKHRQAANFDEVTRLRERLQDYQSCPRCGKDFMAEAQPIADAINEIVNDARPHKGLPSLEALHEDEEARRVYEGLSQPDPQYAAWARVVGEVDFDQSEWNRELSRQPPSYKLGDLLTALKSREARERYEQLSEQIDGIEIIPFDQALFNKAKVTLKAVQEYQIRVRVYEEAVKKNKELEVKIKEKKEEVTTVQGVIKALQAFKYYVNTYFLPSVSKAASGMLLSMTNGKRKKVVITDKFEISVDGNSVEAMSGSTKAIVNIAIRMALQAVLTKKSFSVFLGDEIDSAFDAERAKSLAETLTGMKDHISQVLVISHRQIKADNVIKL